MTRMRLILNGKSAGRADVRAAIAAIRKDGVTIEPRVTWEGGDAARLTREALDDAAAGRIDTIVAGGGDGTVNEVLASAAATGVASACSFGVLPLGTANDFARSADIPVDDLTAALRIAATSPPRSIDLGAVDGQIFVNLLSGGYGSRITVETDPELKRRLGGLAYLLTGVARLSDLSASVGTFRAEGFEWHGAFLAVAIGNGRQAGGGIPLCPEALLDDGKLDLTILPDLPAEGRGDALNALLRDGIAALQTIPVTTRSSWIEYESAQPLHVNLDGEPNRLARFRAECRPAALRMRLGPKAAVAGV